MKPTKVLARLKPASWDEETQTVDAVLSTGAGVKRRDARGEYVEFLDIDSSTVADLPPLLNSHRTASLDDLLGRVFDVRKQDGALVAKLHIDRADIAARVRSGVIRDVSIGYSIAGVVETPATKTRARSKTARVHVHEASLVVIPADPGATVRSDPMPKKTGANAAPENVENENDENTVAQTRAEIRAIIKRAGGTPEDADAIIDSDGGVAEANTRALAIIEARTAAAPRVRVVNPGVSPQEMLQRRQDAIYARVTGTRPNEAAREFYNVRLVDHARAFLAERNVSTLGMSDFDVITRAHTVSDYPLLLEGTGNRVLMEQFEAAQTPLIRLARQATAPDFRNLNRLRISEMGALQPLAENGELQNVSRSEIADAYAIESAGAIFSMSFRAQVNDDLSAFADWGRAMGQQAAQYQKNTLVDLIQGNPNSEDNQPLFSVAHNNVAGDRSGVTVDALSAARLAIRTQRGLDGVTTLNLRPQFLLVSAELETQAEQVLADIAATTVNDANPFSGSLELMVESALTRGDWYVFASPNAAPVIEHAWLQGYTGPQLASQENFRTLARDYRCVMHWGAGLLPGGWRGAYFNQGSADSNTAFV